MSGTKYFLDTNAVIAFLKGNSSFEGQLFQAAWIGISVISVIEFLSFPSLSQTDKINLEVFTSRVVIVSLLNDLTYLESLANFKAANKLKLPDAVIAHAAIANNAILISNDKHFQNINQLIVLNF